MKKTQKSPKYIILLHSIRYKHLNVATFEDSFECRTFINALVAMLQSKNIVAKEYQQGTLKFINPQALISVFTSLMYYSPGLPVYKLHRYTVEPISITIIYYTVPQHMVRLYMLNRIAHLFCSFLTLSTSPFSSVICAIQYNANEEVTYAQSVIYIQTNARLI